VIRPARADDYPALQHIERRAGERFRTVGMPDVAGHEPYTDDELDHAEAVLVATDEAGTPVGYAMVTLVDGHAHLEGLAVLPEAGRRGIGTSLLDAVATWSRHRGDDQLTLTTFRDVPFNAPLYAKRGFTPLDEETWTPAVRALVAREAGHGLDPDARVVMRRLVQ
jgi:GNAT superfamily N-acetyltransferase